MLNFTVGPVMSDEAVLSVGAEQVPYFRTQEFSEIMLENEYLIKKFAGAAEDARAVFITGSGTAAMEAAIVNAFTSRDKLLIINGGSFGQRFVELCQIHKIPFSEIRPAFGKGVTADQLQQFSGRGYTALVVNIHETSTGVCYDLDLLSRFCKEENLFFTVDAISAFLADPIDMQKQQIDMMITGSQKALACPPGISVIVLSKRAVDRVYGNDPHCMYLDLRSALRNGDRGQTPFTPAVGILLQINKRLKMIHDAGGAEAEIRKTASIAEDFRSALKENRLPLEIVSQSLSNAVTPLHPLHASAYDIFLTLKDEYQIWVCPNGGDMKEKVFRVGHIGCLTVEDNKTLIDALIDMKNRNLL
ncbi:MAG: aminotransferase class V-fold PLP-dependent enzyme [Lachnospiraceae bacterium]|nr:aminotransferase class V-fold PLP-dependent enzyme [Lachnospiraceae bacterium]